MKFLLLVHHSEAAFSQMPEATRQAMLAESVQLTHQLHVKGQYRGASPLHPSSTGARVKVRDGKVLVTDGPFVETHEQIAGYFMVDVAEIQEAIAIAGKIPGARIGTVEVRQVREIPGLPEEGMSK